MAVQFHNWTKIYLYVYLLQLMGWLIKHLVLLDPYKCFELFKNSPKIDKTFIKSHQMVTMRFWWPEFIDKPSFLIMSSSFITFFNSVLHTPPHAITADRAWREWLSLHHKDAWLNRMSPHIKHTFFSYKLTQAQIAESFSTFFSTLGLRFWIQCRDSTESVRQG